jgi:hypothetical protein
MSPISGA